MDATAALNNPLAIQSTILKEYTNRFNGQDVEIVDANNTFSFLTETFSQIVAQATVNMNSKLEDLYPIRATTTEALFNHISDYEYVGFFGYPASIKLMMMLHRDYIIKNAVAVEGTNYKLIIIPADTIFSIGRFKFGLYYPIHIKINTLIDTITVSYDTTDNNPLKSLSTNTIEVKNDNYQGLNLISFEFDVYQFNKVVYTESINPKIGFIKKYTYADKFYAMRIFDISNSQKKELAYTLADNVYDPANPTAILKVLPEENAVIVNLPQIYLTKELVGAKLQIELFNTTGAIDVSIVNISSNDISANFAMNSTNTKLTYTNILRTIPTIIIQPINTRIVGGSDNLSFKEIKDFAIYHNNASSVPITRLDLERYFSKNGFSYMAKLDNLTDRRYYAYRKLYNNDEVLGVTNGNITIPYKEPNIPNTNVLYQNNDTIVILPTAILKFIDAVGKFEILSDAETNAIKNSSGNELANKLNTNNYFCNPHHIVISTLDRYPTSSFYDLFTTDVSDVTFIEENAYLSAQLSLVSVVVKHVGNGSGGYILRVGIQRSEDLGDTPNSDIGCFLTAISKEGYRVGMRGTYIDTYNGIDVFDFNLTTNYKLKSDRITITNMKAANDLITEEYEIDLSGTMFISTYVKKSLFPTISQNTNILNYLTYDDNSWLAVSLQSFKYKLGSNLDDVVDPNLLSSWTALTYKTYDYDVPLLYDHDVYETVTGVPNGVLKYEIVDGKVVLNKIHSIGDIVYSNGEIVYQFRTTDIVKDANGEPIEEGSRLKDFTINLNAYEYSHNIVINDFFIELSKTLAAYYSTIREMSKSILENTDVYFAPLITTNNGMYRINNTTTISASLELSFEFNCYVSQATIDDSDILTNIESKIVEIVISHLSDEIISLTEIAGDIKNTLSVYVNSIDAISLNGMTDVQTLMNISINKSPKIGRKLVIGTDNRLAYKPLITVNFKALDI